MSIWTSQAYYNLKVGVRPIFIWKIFRRAVISSQKEPPIILEQFSHVPHTNSSYEHEERRAR